MPNKSSKAKSTKSVATKAKPNSKSKVKAKAKTSPRRASSKPRGQAKAVAHPAEPTADFSYVGKAKLVDKKDVKYTFEDKDCHPTPNDDGSYTVRIAKDSEISLPYRTSNKVYCGFSITVPRGFVVQFELDERFSERGVIAENPKFTPGVMQKFYVRTHISGKEIVPFEHKKPIGRFWLVPVENFRLMP